MTISKNTGISVFILICVAVAIAVAVLPRQHKTGDAQTIPLIGVAAYLVDCAKIGKVDSRCTSIASIQATYHFDLMAEVNGQYQKMKKTAAAIAAGTLTDDAYTACLKNGGCAKVPMLGEGEDANTEKGKKISKAFWDLAEGKTLTPAICEQIAACAIGVQNNALTMKKNKVTAAKTNGSVKAVAP